MYKPGDKVVDIEKGKVYTIQDSHTELVIRSGQTEHWYVVREGDSPSFWMAASRLRPITKLDKALK